MYGFLFLKDVKFSRIEFVFFRSLMKKKQNSAIVGVPFGFLPKKLQFFPSVFSTVDFVT